MTDKKWWDEDSPPSTEPWDLEAKTSETIGVLAVFLGLIAFVVVIIFVLSRLDFSPSIHEVRYEVSSNCVSVDVFYENEWGGTSSKEVDTSGDKKWTYSYETEFDGFTFMYVSGQANCDQDEVKVLTALYIDDQLVDYEMCEGGYCIATASDMR